MTLSTPSDCPPENELVRFLNDSLAQGQVERIESHLGECANCQDRLQRLMVHSAADVQLGEKTQVKPSEEATQVKRSTKSSYSQVDELELPGFEDIQYLDRGGMGVVFRAKQTRHGREVAVKLVRPDGLKSDFVKRFEREIEIQATIEHPQIARLYEVGQTDDGQLYLVMEHVDGIPIDDYCHEHKLPLKERLSLFAKACDVVQGLHNYQVIHRDLKPSHLLIRAGENGPEPVLIDFGLAKYTDQISHLNEDLTQPFSPLGSLRYMSPEQAGGKVSRLTTLTDEYSLGVILYLLLSGETPIDKSTRDDSDLLDLLRRIQVEDVKPPSQGLKSNEAQLHEHLQSLGLSAERLAALLSGDLDAITLKALEITPKDRYQTVAELAADVRRWINDEVVIAREPTRFERATKFYRRNRSVVATITAFIAVCLLGIVFTSVGLWRARIAEGKAEIAASRESEMRKEADEKRALAETRLENFNSASKLMRSIFDNLNPEKATVGDGALREELLRNIETASREIQSASLGNSDEILKTKESLANVAASLGSPESAVTQWEHIVDEVIEVRGSETREAVEANVNLAVALYKAHRLQESQDLLMQMAQVSKGLYPEGDITRLTIAGLIASVQKTGGQMESANDINKELLKRLREYGHTDTRLWLDTLNNLAGIQFNLKNYEEAANSFQSAITAAEKSYPETHPFLITARLNLAATHDQLGEHSTAIKTLESLESTVASAYPADSLLLAQVRSNLSVSCAKAGQHLRAMATLQEVIDNCREDHVVMRCRIEQASLRIWHLDEADQGIADLHELVERCREKYGPEDETTRLAQGYLNRVAEEEKTGSNEN